MAENVQDDFEGAFTAWLRDQQDRSPHTVRGYTGALRDFAAWFAQSNGERFTPAAITQADVRLYRQYLQANRKLAPATVNRHLAALRAFARWAQDAGLIAHNPVNGVRWVAQETPGPRWLDRREQGALLRAAQKEIQVGDLRAGGDKTHPGYIWPRRDVALVVLLLNAGLRLAEVAALTLADVAINERSGKVIVRQGKGRKYREVPLNANARKVVREWLEVRPQDQGDELFLSLKGGALSERGVSARVAALAKAAGLEEVSVHVLRHSFAKNLVDAGVGLEKVAALLGHSSVAVTQRYITPSQADLQAATEAVAWQE